MILTIKYKTEGIFHKYQTLIDKEWNISKRIILDKRTDLPYEKPNKCKPVQKIMHNNENVISMTNHTILINKN